MKDCHDEKKERFRKIVGPEEEVGGSTETLEKQQEKTRNGNKQ